MLTDGSTRPGPGFKRNVSLSFTQNQMRPPAMCGMVTRLDVPGGPSGMLQSTAKGVPVEAGEAG